MTILQSIASGAAAAAAGMANSVLDDGAVTGVGPSTVTTIFTFTAGATTRINHVSCSGDTYAKFTAVLDTNVIDTRRMSGSNSLDFFFNMSINAGQIFEIKAEHFQTGVTDAMFEATLYGWT